MDELIKESLYEITKSGHSLTNLSITEITISLILSFILSIIIVWIYKKNHSQISYSQSFAHTIIIMGTVVSLIMMIIGSNIARAFSLVGALSIIRFRSAIKEPQDVAYIFFAMAIGMACGTKFYLAAIVSCFIIGSFIFLINWLQIGKSVNKLMLLKILLPVNIDYSNHFNKIFDSYLEDYKLISIDTAKNGIFNRLTYTVKLKDINQTYKFLENIKKYNDNNDVSLLNEENRLNI